MPSAGQRMLPLVLMVALVSGCGLVHPNSSYKVKIPDLSAQPMTVHCKLVSGAEERCTVLLESDYEALVRELKAACLATGQSAVECQAE